MNYKVESQLRDSVASNDPKTKVKKSPRVFFFTGQGAQYAGMGSDLFRTNAFFANTLIGYQNAAVAMGLPPFLTFIADKDQIGAEDMTATQLQLAMVALEMALTHLLRTWGMVPDVVIGHSLGEYAALHASGVLSVSDVLYLVEHRAMLMEEHLKPNTYGMLATGLGVDSLLKIMETLNLTSCNIACINAPSSTVASGTVEDLDVLQSQIQQQSRTARTTLLKVLYGFHSRQMEPILDQYQDLARGIMFAKADVPIISTLTGMSQEIFSPAYLARQAREPVNFASAVCTARDEGFVCDNTVFVEIGPEPICLALARRTLEMPLSAHLLPTLKASDDNWITISNILKAAYETGDSINWPQVHREYKDSVALLDLPKYAFDNKTFWSPYEDPVTVLPSVVDEPPKLAGFPTPSLQRVESETIDESGKQVKVIFSSDLNNSDLLRAIEGHVVNKHKICPTGVYTDMALTAAGYAHFALHRRSYSGAAPTIRDFVMSHALALVPGEPKPTFFVTSTYSIVEKTVGIVFHSRIHQKETTHGSCQVHFEDSSETWKTSQAQTLFLLQARIEALREQAASGKAHRIPKPIVYRLFSTVVNYGEHYHALEEVILDTGKSFPRIFLVVCCHGLLFRRRLLQFNVYPGMVKLTPDPSTESRDAIGTVRLPSTCPSPTDKKTFSFDPYSVDAVTHLAGFVLNSGLRYGEDFACISVGFSAWREIEELNRDKTYTSYVCMQEVSGGSFLIGDCYVFEEESGNLVQATTGIKFQKLKKIILDMVLGVPGPSATESSVLVDHARVENISPMVKPDADGPSHQSTSPPPHPDILNKVLGIVAAESGCSMEELSNDNAAFTDLGVDSLMAITVLAVVKRETGIDIDAGFFIENDTLGSAKQALLERYGTDDKTLSPTPPSRQETPATHDESTATASASSNSTSTPVTASTASSAQSSPSTSGPKSEGDLLNQAAHRLENPPTSPTSTQQISKTIHLQGSRAADATKLFLIADETGSALGYIPLPNLGPNLCVYGVEAPFAKEPTGLDHEITMTQLATPFAAAIRREQPYGPYLLGGISFGATLAVEIARALLQDGESVGGLLLLDPADEKLLQARLAAGSAGMANAVQKEHIKRVLQILKSYGPLPLAVEPHKSVVVMRDQTSNRVERRWKTLVPGMVVRHVEGVQQVEGVWDSLLRLPAVSFHCVTC